jgi:hypothetical protein
LLILELHWPAGSITQVRPELTDSQVAPLHFISPSMFFNAKQNGYYVELAEATTAVARTSGSPGALVVEEVRECATGDEAAWSDIIRHFLPKKAAVAFVRAVCGVYPPNRVIRRATIDPKRVKESGYLNDFTASQFRIEADKYALALLNAGDGTEYDLAKAAVKDVVVAGVPNEEVLTVQERLLAQQVYPERLELGSLAILGGLSDYLRHTSSKSPLLVLELGMESTHSFIVSPEGVEASRPIPQGLAAMVPVVQKELGLKDEESARKLFFSNTFDFTGLGPLLIKRLLKELQSSIGFYEVQTGQSIGHMLCVHLPSKLEWLETVVASQLGIGVLRPELVPWLRARGITLSDTVAAAPLSLRWFGLFSLMAQYDAVASSQEN